MRSRLRQDTRTMTRQEFLRNARIFFAASAISLLLIAAMALLADSKFFVLAMGVSFILFFFLLGGVIAGSYYLVRGLWRPADWVPSAADWSMSGFVVEQEIATLSQMITRELPSNSKPALIASHTSIANTPPP